MSGLTDLNGMLARSSEGMQASAASGRLLCVQEAVGMMS